MSEKRKVPVDMDELNTAFTFTNPDVQYYLDLETGDVILVTTDTLDDLESIYGQIGAEEDILTRPLAEHLQRRDDINVNEWDMVALLQADLVERSGPDRVLLVEPISSHEAYQNMAFFIVREIGSERLRERFEDAIRGRGAFRRFKDLLARYPDLEKRWYAFEAKCIEQYMQDWLDAHDIEPVPRE